MSNNKVNWNSNKVRKLTFKIHTSVTHASIIFGFHSIHCTCIKGQYLHDDAVFADKDVTLQLLLA